MDATMVTDLQKHIDTLTDAQETLRTLISTARYSNIEYRTIAEAFDLLKLINSDLRTEE